MSDECQPALEDRQSSTSLVQGNTSTGGGGGDTSSNDELQQQQQQHQKSAHHHHQQHQRTHKKQFVVGGAHSRHHTRVPSHGRNLNKLGKLTPLGTSPVKGAGSEKVKGGGKKLTFEVGEGGGEGGYKVGGGQELIEGEEEGVEVAPDGSASGGGGGASGGGASASKGLAKSPSAKSLDPQLREGVRRKSHPTSRRASAREDNNKNNKRDRSRSKSREGGMNKKITASSGQVSVVEMSSGRGAGGGGGDAPLTTTASSSSQPLQRKQHQQHTSQLTPAQSKSQSQSQLQNGRNGNANTQSHTAKELHTHLLLPHTKPPSATIPPQVNHESISMHTKIHHTPPPPNAPITPTHSLPNSHDQPLTSRFIDFSNSQGGTSTSISPSSGGGARRSGGTGGRDGAPPSTATSFSTPNPNNSLSAPKSPTDPPSTTPAITPTTIAAKPSRTQQKLWLQRQSSQYEPPMAIPPHAYLSQTYQNPPTHSQSHRHHTYHPASSSHHHSPSAPLSISLSRATHPARLTKEFERVNREYLNTRRFMNPILDSLERAAIGRNPDRRIPKRGHASDASGNNMGLSQSLKETGSLRVGGGVRGGGSIGAKDDSAVARQSVAERGRDRERGGDLHALLMGIWREGELLVSRE
ncbi:hypothetical protein HOY82DRAFT_356964 [Tuber indicum]|nr:hypothetical protein HOY82DRAFT_356964 [Tuber indicum]